MDKRIYVLMTVSFIGGLAELIIVGLLDLIARDLGIRISQAGMLITVFSVTFAISAPVLLFITAKMERRKLTLITLVVFFIGNTLAAISHTYYLLLAARVISAASGALLIVLCVTIASNISAKEKRGKAIGLVYMGISGSLVLGVPAGLMIGNLFGWQAPFVIISFLTLLTIIGIFFLLSPIEVKEVVPLKKQWDSLKNKKLLSAHMTTFLFLAGHYTLYGYLSPYLKNVAGFNETWVTVIYWVFGVAAVSGGAIGGGLSDRIGNKSTQFLVILTFAFSLFIVPYTVNIFALFISLVVVWGAMSWALAPPLQTYLAETAPETSDVQQSLNNSALHLGIAFGSLSGGLVIEHTSITYNPSAGGIFVLFALGTAFYSMAATENKSITSSTRHS